MNQNKFGSRHALELRSGAWLRIVDDVRTIIQRTTGPVYIPKLKTI